MADSAGNWCLIESDPGVFSEIIRDLGKNNVKTVNIRLKVVLRYDSLFLTHILIFFLRFIKLILFLFLGCEGVQVEELWSLDSDNFKELE